VSDSGSASAYKLTNALDSTEFSGMASLGVTGWEQLIVPVDFVHFGMSCLKLPEQTSYYYALGRVTKNAFS